MHTNDTNSANSIKKQRWTVVPASYLLLIKGGKILLLQRANTGYCDGCYSVPAGHLDGNESATAALAREAKEEIGAALDPRAARLVHAMHRKGLNNERVDFFFTADRWEGESKILEPDKCDDLRWFDMKNLPENTIPYVRRAIELSRKGIVYGEHGFEAAVKRPTTAA